MSDKLLGQVQERCLPAVEAYFERFFDSAKKEGFSHNSEMSRYQFSTGGKRLRALIPSWVYAACKQDPLKAIPLGCAAEMIHNATLVHDDLQDGDEIRRGKPTVWKAYSAPQSINCGDAMFQFAFQMLMELELEPAVIRKISQRYVRGTLEVIEGQAQEFLMKDELYPTTQRYLGVVRGKTAALIATPLVAALESLNYSDELCRHVEKAAMECGILFQMQDDLLDIYGDKGRAQRAPDIAEGKVSILIAYLNEVASNSEKEMVANILKTPREKTTDAQIDEVLGLFEKYDCKGAILKKIGSIQKTVENNSELARYPEIQGLLQEMSKKFLKPIQHLL